MLRVRRDSRTVLARKRIDSKIRGTGHEIHEPAIFRALLRHERSRVDRDGSEFCLVVFTATEGKLKGSHLRSLSRRVCRAMRLIDEVGWLTNDSIGVLLPSTGIDGGMKFAARVLHSFQTGARTLVYKVYSYPSHWLAPGDGPIDGVSDTHAGGIKTARGGASAAEFFGSALNVRIPAWKRFLDISGSLTLLLVLSPVLLMIAGYIKVVSPGPVIFMQKRIGFRGRAFTFYKFRTMTADNNQGTHKDHILAAIRSDTPLAKLDDKGDRRIIFGGRILRRSCLDELPQLLNVLRGDMSLVGPRPCMPYEAKEFLQWHTNRFDVLPGMTGLWQVSGKNKLTFSQMIRLDISYARKATFFYDCVIILRTPAAIVKMLFESLVKKLSRGEKSLIAFNASVDKDTVPSLQTDAALGNIRGA